MTEIKKPKNDKAPQTNGKVLHTKGEIMMVVLLITAIIMLTIKSTVLDEVKNLSRDEQQFKDFVEYSVEEEYSGKLADFGLMVYRVYDIDVENSDEKGLLRYPDPKTGEMREVVQEQRYIAKVRGYLFWILPIQHFSITSNIVEQQ